MLLFFVPSPFVFLICKDFVVVVSDLQPRKNEEQNYKKLLQYVIKDQFNSDFKISSVVRGCIKKMYFYLLISNSFVDELSYEKIKKHTQYTNK